MQRIKNNIVGIIILLILMVSGCNKEKDTKVGHDLNPIWSPDGKYIAFNRVLSDILTYPPVIVDTFSGMRLLDLTENRILDSIISSFCIDWFPNGTEILFQRGMVYNLSTHTFRSILDTSLHCYAKDISPNGEKILCVKTSTSVDSSMIVMVDTCGVNSKVLFNSGLAPSWHPSGDKLVFIATFNNKKHICIGDTNGNIIRLIEPQDGDLVPFAGDRPKFSPDGSKIAYSLYQYKDGGLDDYSIHICDSLGRDDRELIDGFHPFWGPYGDKIVFARYSPGEQVISLWIIKRNGSSLKRITD